MKDFKGSPKIMICSERLKRLIIDFYKEWFKGHSDYKFLGLSNCDFAGYSHA